MRREGSKLLTLLQSGADRLFNSDFVSLNKFISYLLYLFEILILLLGFFQSIGGTGVEDFMDRILSEVFHYSVTMLYTWEGRLQTAKRAGREAMKNFKITKIILSKYFNIFYIF